MPTASELDLSRQLALFDEVPPAPAPAAPRVPVRPPPSPPSPRAAVPEGVDFVHPRAQRELRLGAHRVAFELRRARRRSIGFVVGPDGLSVSAPRWVGAAEIDAALREKAGWILRKLHEQRERARRLAAARIAWGDGALVPFLGARVAVLLDPTATGVVLEPANATGEAVRGTLRVALPADAAPAQVRDAVQAWLQRQARRIFDERIAHYAPRLGVRPRRVGLSDATTRWGSASADGSIRLHWRLVHFGMPVIDYVVTHELAHLREMNHGPAFWSVVRSVMPDFEHHRGMLRQQPLPAFD